MILDSHELLQAARRLRFCYICGAELHRDRTADHVPPKRLFATHDRGTPLVLSAHRACNNVRSAEDQVIGQAVALLRGEAAPDRQQKLRVKSFPVSGGEPLSGVYGFELAEIVWRWVRACHAALYSEWLPSISPGGFLHPWPTAIVERGRLVFDPVRPDQWEYIHKLRQQVRFAVFDGIWCWNQKFKYCCTWLTFDNGQPFCVFGVDVYDWVRLSDPRTQPRRGCAGWYTHPTPPNATRGTSLELPTLAIPSLDPFEGIDWAASVQIARNSRRSEKR